MDEHSKKRLRFKEYLKEVEEDARLEKAIDLLEHQIYKLIPNTRNSYREDPANTTTLTQRHAHVYAKPDGKGSQLYAANLDGSGHDGSSGVEIPGKHAAFLRSKGYEIPDTNILESITIEELDPSRCFVYVLLDE